MKRGSLLNYSILKIFLDKIISLPLLLVGIPLILLFAAITALHLHEFPLFSQFRGLCLNKGFKIYKIRTIKKMHSLVKCHDIFIKNELSPYTTKFSCWLRRTGLDELPQLFNVIKGEMSLVGPRPLSLQDLLIMKANYPEYYKLRKNLTVKPGITGLWQIKGIRELGISNMIKLDKSYIEDLSFIQDMKIILKTIFIISLARNYGSIAGAKSMNQKEVYKLDRLST